jgi:hypothetical protein
MRRYVQWVIRQRILVVVAVVLITVVLGLAGSRVRIDINRKTQLPQDHPLIKIENKVTDLFGGARITAIAIVPKEGDIYQPAVLAKIRRITDAVDALPGVVHHNVLSISALRAKAITGAEDGMVVLPLMDEVPSDPAGMAALKKRIAGQSFYKPLLVSEKGAAAAVLADFYETDDNLQPNPVIHQRLQELVDREADGTVDFYLTGMPIWLSYLDRYAREMPWYLLAAVVIIGLIHYEAFRTIQAMLLPLVTAVLSVVWSLGWLGLTGLPMDTWNSMTPILVLAVAAGHAVQILKRYYEEYERLEDNQAAVVEAVVKVGHAMILAGVMAALGFLSLLLFDVRTVRVFGLVTAAGILSALFLEMTFIPAIRSLLPPPLKGGRTQRGKSPLDRFVEWLADVVPSRTPVVLAAGALVLLIAGAGATRMVVNNSFNAAMPDGHPYRIAEKVLNRYFGGSNTMNILIDSNEPDGIKRPDVLRAMNDLQDFLKDQEWVGATQSLADYVKRMNQAMHNDDPAFARIPDDRAMVGQYLLLYSLSAGPDDFDMVVDKDYRQAVLRVFAKNDDDLVIRGLFRKTEKKAAGLFPPGVTVSVAGGTLGTALGLSETVLKQKIINVCQILLITFAFGSLVFRSLSAGLLVLLPSTIAMLANLGTMGLLGIPLSLGTATTSALTISIGADYAVYVLYRFREEAGKDRDVRAQAKRVLLSTGKAVFYVSSAIAAGFAILVPTGLSYYRQLGGLVSSSMVLSSLAAVTLMPALIVTFRPKFITQPAGSREPRSAVCCGRPELALAAQRPARNDDGEGN